MAETEPLSDVAEEALKGISKTKALNGHSNFSEEKQPDEEANRTREKIENGERECKSPQLNGDISDKSALENNCELMETDDNISSRDNNESNEESVIKDTPEKESVAVTESDGCPDSEKPSEEGPSEAKSATSSDSENKSVNISNNSELSESDEKGDVVIKDSAQSTSSDSDIVTPASDGGDSGEVKSSKESKDESEMNVELTGEEESKKEDKEKSEEKEDVKTEEEAKKTDENEAKEGEKKEENELKEGEKNEDEKEADKKDEKDGGKPQTTPSKSKKKDKDQPKPEIVKRVTRSASGIVKPVRYIDSDPKLLSEDEDDEIRITKEVKKDSESDIEMIEESDPLAISDADVKKAKEASKSTPHGHDRFRAIKRGDHSKGKDSSNVIIIDTNTLLKGQGNQGSASSHSRGHISAGSVSASAQTTGSNTAAANIQTAIQAITGGNPAIQGLQSAYLNAIQQVLVAQGGSQVSNPHYIATLQQYYNTLGALQDDAYVIEAPSFIVPYVMEGKPTESIKDYLTRINKEEEDKIKKEEEEKKKKEEEENKKKEEEENKKKEEEEREKKKKEEEGKEKTKDEEKENKMEEGDEKKIEDEEKLDEDVEKKAEEDEEKKDKDVANKAEEEKKEDEEETMEVDEESKKEEEKEEKMETDDVEEVKENEKEGKKEKDEEKTKTKDEDEEKEAKTKEEEKGSGDENKENQKAKKGEEDVIDLDNEPEKPPADDLSHLGRWEGYYKSALGKFFMDLGLNHAQEFIQSDLLRMQKRRLDKMKSNPSKQDVMSVKTLERQLSITREKNSHLHVPLKTCKFCSFKTESSLAMQRHLESPHMVNYTYKCNFCEFETRGPQVILFHTEAEHNVRGRLERAPAFFQCPLCPFEDNNKSKMTRHSFSCTKKFKADKNCDLHDWEPPAKIPKIHRGRPNSFGKTFDALKMPNILPKNLGGLSLNLQNAISSGLLGNAASLNSLAGRGRGRPIGSYKNLPQPITGRSGALMYQNRVSNILQPMGGTSSAQQLSIANQVLQSVTQGAANRSSRIQPSSATAGKLIPGLAASSSITIQSVQNKSGNSKSPQQPSISITPLPRSGNQSPGGKSAPATGNSNNSQRPAFVICEICDGYIKDLEQLRNHMNLIHKVKIHPKMIYNRPPLNCQKCQHRFFTDQGLERHLLGTHGLVTSSMQEAANKGKDAGRCPICGKVFQWKLLNHVSRDHKMTLKPAHLSYKCTVCTATFNMYRLFENHVYSAHSVVNKNKSSSEGNSSNTSNATAATKKQTTNTSNEAPLKINDEITIIPQPTFKSPKTDSKSSSSPKKSDSVSVKPTMSKEITITKVGSRTSRRSGGGGGGGVEVISLDDSPQKKQSDEPPKKRPRDTSTSKRARTST